MSRILNAIRSLAMAALVGLIIFASAGRFDLPMVWGVLGVLAVLYFAIGAFTAPGLMSERLRPGPGNQDRLSRPIGSLLLLMHWILAGLDVGRFHWTPISWPVQLIGLVGYAAAMGVLFWAVRANPFYSSVVRVQTERGHYPVAAGPYRFIRHPGYAATLIGVLAGGVALGSWLAMLPVLGFVIVFIRRTLLEDRLLHQNLAGYADYEQQVRYRLLPGIF